MNNLIRNFFSFDRYGTIEHDEVLRTINYRTAFQTLTVMSWLIASIGLALVYADAPWNVVGITLLCISCSYLLVFESIRAFRGVLRGQMELATRLQKGKSFAKRLAIRQTLLTALISFTLQLITSEHTDHLLKMIFMSAVFGSWTYFISYHKWWKLAKQRGMLRQREIRHEV